MRTMHFAVLIATAIPLAGAGHAATWQAIVPDVGSEGWRELAQDWLRAAGQPVATIRSVSGFLGSQAVLTPGTCLLVVGHAGNNALLARWYARGLDSTDLEYPGAGGYVLRPLSWVEETPGPVIIAGAATVADLRPAQDEFVQLVGSASPHMVVKLGGNWPAVAAKEKQWCQAMLALPVLGDRQDAGHMRWTFSASMQPLTDPEATTWPIWMQRMIALACRAAEGVHATGDPDAQALLKRVLQNLLAHLPPAETSEPGQQKPGEWMGEYYWPILVFSLLQSRSFLETDPELAQAVDRGVYASAAGWLQTTIYRGAFLGQSRPGILGGRHETADLYGWYLTAAYLLKSPHLSQAERDAVRGWLGNCDRYFAAADMGVLSDDNPINYDDVEMVAGWWLDRGRQQAVAAGGADWTARYLISQVDNTNRVASWGYEYAQGPASSHLAAPLRKVALLANRPDWMAWSQRWRLPGGDTTFWLPRFGSSMTGSPWGTMHDYRWTPAAQGPLTDESLLTPSAGLQVLPLPTTRALAMGPAAADRPLYSVSARLGTRPDDPHVAMIGSNGLFVENVVAGAIVHFSARGQSWLRGSVDDIMSTSHNRTTLSDAPGQSARHALKLTWQHQEAEWAGWEVQETLPDRQWRRCAILFRPGALLVVDRVRQTAGEPRPWLTTWMPLDTPRRDGTAWAARHGAAKLWLLTDHSQALQLEGMGETVDKRPLPGGPWLLRGLAVGTAAPGVPRFTLLSVGAADGQRPTLQSDAQGCALQLADGGPAWRVTLSEAGVALAPAQTPTAAAAAAAATPGPAAATVPTTADPAAVFAALGVSASLTLKGDADAALLGQEVLWLRSDGPSAIPLPTQLGVREVELRRWGAQPGQPTVTALTNGAVTETQPLPLDTAWLINGWKGYAEAAQIGRARLSGSADEIRLAATPESGTGKVLLRALGRPAAPIVASPWMHLALWPQAGGPCLAAVDQRSLLRVVDASGRERWQRATPGCDCTGLAASPDRLAVLQSDERVVVLDPQGREVWHAALNQITKTGFGNIPFRALWQDVTGDGVADLLVAQFCFECALDGRDGKLLGKSEFIASFWPQLLGFVNGQLWTAPAYSSALRFWQPPQGSTRYLCADTVSPRTGGNPLALRSIGGRLLAVREQLVCSISKPVIPETFGLEGVADWLWPAPDPLTAGGISARGTVAVGDLFGTVRLLDERGQEVARVQLPQVLVGLEAAGVGASTRWLAIGRQGGAWVLDESLKPLLHYESAEQPWQRPAGPGAPGVAVVGADAWVQR